MEKYDFLLMYEHKVREFDSLCLLKYELDKRGYKTKILYINDWDLLQSYHTVYTTKVLVIGYCYTSSSIRDYASYRIKFDKVVNLQWEQVIDKEQEDDSKSFRNLTGLAKEIVHISWGEKNYERLVRKAGVAPENIKITGNITMDLLRPEFHGFYLPRRQVCEKYHLDDNKKICLFIAGFKYIEASKRDRENNIKRFGEGRRRYLEIAEKEQLTLLQWFERFLQERGDVQIVYRPHPGTTSPRAEELAKRYDNFVVISELSVKQWIVIGDIICAWDSTAIFEAFFAGVNPYFLCPYPIPEQQSHSLFAKMNKIENYAAFYGIMTGEDVELGLTKEMVNPYYLVDEKTASYLKVCDALEEVYADARYNWTPRQRKQYRALYTFKEKAAIFLAKCRMLHLLYLWMLEHISFGFLQERRAWLEKRSVTEQEKWREMNQIELAEADEAEQMTAKIKKILEG